MDCDVPCQGRQGRNRDAHQFDWEEVGSYPDDKGARGVTRGAPLVDQIRCAGLGVIAVTGIEIAVGIVVFIVVVIVLVIALVRRLVGEALPAIVRIAAAAADIVHAGVAGEAVFGLVAVPGARTLTASE